MDSIARQCAQNADQVLSVLPDALGFHRHRISDRMHELRSGNCIIRLAFDRYDATSVTISIFDPRCDPPGRSDMAFWILRHIRGIGGLSKITTEPFKAIGRMLAEHFKDVLAGDYSVRAQYDRIENRILDRIFEVRALPADHPTRIRFENYDFRWLDDLEEAEKNKGGENKGDATQ